MGRRREKRSAGRTPDIPGRLDTCMGMRRTLPLGLATVALLAGWLRGQDHRVVVEAGGQGLLGVADAASAGVVDAATLARRPLRRVGEVLEAVPGVVVTQHSGAGKGNQMFLRGFDLDHGTDLRTTVAGIPANLPSHAHGQGYTDLAFVIPELIEAVRYRKGPYSARDGDFASAGAIDVDYVRRLDCDLALAEAGSFGATRALFAHSRELGGGDLLLAVEGRHDDGPWHVPDDYDRVNGVLRWSRGDDAAGCMLTAMGHDGRWTATDQIAARAVARGDVARFGTHDPTSGGSTGRYSLHGTWWHAGDAAATRAAGYAQLYDLDLFSNFTYALADPVNGDQIEQTDRRATFGLDLEQQWFGSIGGLQAEHGAGLGLRSDRVRTGLHGASRRARGATVRRDSITEHQASLWVESRLQWAPKVRSVAGLRADAVWMDVDSDLAANSGDRADARLSPKLGLAVGPWAGCEVHANAGFGFHSNDARGATQRDDPTTAAPLDGMRVDPLVRSRGAELGLRTAPRPGLHGTLAAFVLDLDSELVFAGDAGTTEASGASRRLGIESTASWAATPWLSLDGEVAWTRARFRGAPPGNDRIPGAVETLVAGGVTVHAGPWFGSLRTRYVGPRPLVEDDSVRSRVLWLWNLRLGGRLAERTTLTLDVLNLLDEQDADIEYFYASRLPGEPPGPDDGGHADVHFHPVEPFTVRLTLQSRF
jgi:hypothetical protein